MTRATVAASRRFVLSRGVFAACLGSRSALADETKPKPGLNPNGTATLNLVGIGHSHLHSLTAACREFAAAHPDQISYFPICLLDPPYAPAFTGDSNSDPNPAWMRDMRTEFATGASGVLYIGGSDHFKWGLTPGPHPFDFVDPEHPSDAPLLGGLVPYDLILAESRGRLGYVKRIIEVVQGATGQKLVELPPPPPPFDLESLIRPHHQDLLAIIKDHGVSPAPFRLKIWRVMARALSEVCADAGVECLPVPPGATTPEGYLRPELAGDPVHGNIAWGRLCLSMLLARAGLQGGE